MAFFNACFTSHSLLWMRYIYAFKISMHKNILRTQTITNEGVACDIYFSNLIYCF